MKKWERWVIYPLLLISLIASLVAICRTCPRTELDFDYIGLMVGVLSLLVTMLIGWQIYNAMNLDRKVSDIRKEYEGLKQKNEELVRQQENIKVYNEASMEFIQGMAMLSRNTTELAQAYRIFCLSLLHYIESGIDVEDNADKCLRGMQAALRMNVNGWRYGGIKDEIDKTALKIMEKRGMSCNLVVRFFSLEKEREQMGSL